MDRNPDPVTPPPRPPRFAEFLISVLSRTEVRDALLGDLAEEFEVRAEASRRRAYVWYCGQTMRSMPYLLYARLRNDRSGIVLINLLAIATGTVFMLAWDVIISRNAARLVAAWDSPPALLVIRGVYFSVLSVGALICGLLISHMRFSQERTFWRNVMLYHAPVLLVLAGLAMISVLERGFVETSAYLLMRTGLIAMAMLLAAAIVFFRQPIR